jgi:glutaredoxin-related protein
MADHDEVLWRKRLRWRLRGASQWPTFAVLLVVDAILLHLLPIAGESQPGLVPALLLSGFFNLVVVAALTPLAGARLRRRRPGMPKVVADDRAGTWLLLGLAVVLVAAGVAHRPALHAARDDFAAEMAAVRRYIAAHAPPEYRRNIDRADTWKQGPQLYRTCVPGPDPDRALCLIVQTGQSQPGIAVDPDQQPNAKVAGADNPGRLDP